jgi:hypothetical protein
VLRLFYGWLLARVLWFDMSRLLAWSSAGVPKGLSATGVLMLAFLLPTLLGTRAWANSYADHWATAIAAQLSALLVPVTSTPSEAGSSAILATESEPEVASAALAAKHPQNQTSRARPPGAQHGVRISSAQVLVLAARRAMPQAAPVKATRDHPAGLLLRGVSALGVGLQDGDVLTEAAGQKASSVAVVVGVVLAARGRQVAEISGRFFRAGVPFGLVVEQPYLKLGVPG